MANVSDAIVAAVERATQLIKDWAIPKNHGIGNKGKYLKVNDDGSTGYADTPGGSETGHTHANKAVLDSITTHNLVDYTGYKINMLGDSIVTGKDGAVSSGNVTKTITDIIAEKLGCTVRNYGRNGSTLGGDGSAVGQYTYLSRYSAMDDDANMIVVFGGTNDYGLSKCVPVGKIGDTTNATFYGSLDILIKGLIEKYPSAELRFITPIRRSTTSANTHGNTLDQYAKAMIEVCRKYSVPCYDAYNGFGVHVADAAWKTANMPDGLHPTQAFYYHVADMVQDAILTRPCASVDYSADLVSLNANLEAIKQTVANLPNSSGSGLTEEVKTALLNCFRNVSWINENGQTYYNALESALASENGTVTPNPEQPDAPIITLQSISAIYDGGDVPVGTSVNDLKGITVTAHYSDDSTQTVTNYTLSGTIAEGSNTITVSYQGKTCVFIVTGASIQVSDDMIKFVFDGCVLPSGGANSVSSFSAYEYVDLANNIIDFPVTNSIKADIVCDGYTVVTEASKRSADFKAVSGFKNSSGRNYFSFKIPTADLNGKNIVEYLKGNNMIVYFKPIAGVKVWEAPDISQWERIIENEAGGKYSYTTAVSENVINSAYKICSHLNDKHTNRSYYCLSFNQNKKTVSIGCPANTDVSAVQADFESYLKNNLMIYYI